MTDRAGEERVEEAMPTFLFRYEHDGKTWGFEVQAKSIGDARERLSKLGAARYDGVLAGAIDAE